MVGSGKKIPPWETPLAAHKLAGFTLFEMIVVLIVVSVASALVLPMLADSAPGYKLQSAAKAMAASLRYARNRAATESTTVAVVFDRSDGSISIRALPPENGPWQALITSLQSDDADSRVQRYRLPDGIRMDIFDINGNPAGKDFSVFFFPPGNCSGGNIVLTNEKGKKILMTIDFMIGEVRLAAV